MGHKENRLLCLVLFFQERINLIINYNNLSSENHLPNRLFITQVITSNYLDLTVIEEIFKFSSTSLECLKSLSKKAVLRRQKELLVKR